ncbi:hypothetical protein LTR10_007499 [Elasticomyces elasticus]|nr:hypothetical protein LTR10_007499 [Elasticomyces elasticus]KAK4979306.1 hypothetical protein LTR42_001809 [Elasticomyces elasticus]
MQPSRFPDLDDYDTEEDESPSNGLRQRGTVRHENDTTMRDSPSYSLNTSYTTEDVTGFHDSQTIKLLPPLDLGLDYLTEEDEVPFNDLRRGSNIADEATIVPDTAAELDTTMRDAVPARRIPTAPFPMLDIDLATMSDQDRDDYYYDLFKTDVPVQDLNIPLIAYAFPQFEAEIIDAYFELSTFVFKVFTNYDAACERFYTDEKDYNAGRYSDCGKIQLSPRQRAHLQHFNIDKIAFKNVRLDICSHWTKLASITLEVRPGTSASEIVHVDHFVNQIAVGSALETFIDNTAHQIADPEQDTTNGKLGFHMSDLETVAKMFVREQSKAAKEAAKHKYSNNGTWEEYDKANANRGYAEYLTCYSERTGGYSFGSRTWNSGTGGHLFGSRIQW